MKFDFIIGNPPYQEDVSDSDNKTFSPPIYDKFMSAAYDIADRVLLIHPARFLFNAGSTPKEWNRKMLDDDCFKILYYEPRSDSIFHNTEIKGGVVISYRDATKKFGSMGVFIPYDELRSIKEKVWCVADASIQSIIFTQNRFDLDRLYASHPEYRNVIGSDGRDKRFRNNIFDKIPAFMEKPCKNDSIAVIGVIKNKRNWRYIDASFVDRDHENLFKWKVIIPRANGRGTLDDVFSTPVVIAPKQAYTQTFIGVGAFDFEYEADNLLKYVKTKFLRTMLNILKVDQHNERDTWRYVPMQDFSSLSDIDWAKPIPEIDRQLYKKYGLDDAEIEFIETHVKEMS